MKINENPFPVRHRTCKATYLLKSKNSQYIMTILGTTVYNISKPATHLHIPIQHCRDVKRGAIFRHFDLICLQPVDHTVDWKLRPLRYIRIQSAKVSGSIGLS